MVKVWCLYHVPMHRFSHLNVSQKYALELVSQALTCLRRQDPSRLLANYPSWTYHWEPSRVHLLLPLYLMKIFVLTPLWGDLERGLSMTFDSTLQVHQPQHWPTVFACCIYMEFKVSLFLPLLQYLQPRVYNREGILLHYSSVLQPFAGVMTFVMIFTIVRFHSLHSDAHIAAVVTALL